MVYVLGPSHIHKEIVYSVPCARDLFDDDCVLEGYCGLPNWSSHIPRLLGKYSSKHDNVIWIVSDWKFNNIDYDILSVSSPGTLIDTYGAPGNVDKLYMTDKHIRFLASYSISMIDKILKTIPSCRLIFWCLYQRTMANTSSYPEEYQYPAIAKRYKANIIDIGDYTTPSSFHKYVLDAGGHPNFKGYKLLADMIKQ